MSDTPNAENGRCVGIQVTPLGGGIRQVSGCWRRVVESMDGQDYCRQHADEKRYSDRKFQKMMDEATRHVRSFAIHNKGVHCMCGAFVPDGTDHPWGVPWKQEQAAHNDGSGATDGR